MVFRKHQLVFRKCVKELNGTVCAMCRRDPHNLPPEVIRDLPKRSQGGLFWDVTEDPNLPGSHRSLLQTLNDLGQSKAFEVDKEVRKDFGRCTREDCGGFTNDSTVDAERHLRHDHGLGTSEAIAPAGYLCTFEQGGLPCGLRFETRKKMNEHKRLEKHIKTKKVANKEGGADGQADEGEAEDVLERADEVETGADDANKEGGEDGQADEGEAEEVLE